MWDSIEFNQEINYKRDCREQQNGRRLEFAVQAVWLIAKTLMKRNGSEHRQ
jgi:hypothetical protein